ncbi:MAG: hypothetical protein J0L93_07340 [Deltaproteobacteria bacterium]|nr:hypothetical protein [Deltaproteobacteria bacterium]
MSKFLIIIFGLSISSAFAHPQDSDPLSNIGGGTEITFQKELNIPPHHTAILLLNGTISIIEPEDYTDFPKAALNTNGDINPHCIMYLNTSSNFDRVLKSGASIKIGGNLALRLKDSIYYYMDISSPLRDIWHILYCSKGVARQADNPGSSDKSEMDQKFIISEITIADFKNILGDIAVIKIPDPQPVQ